MRDVDGTLVMMKMNRHGEGLRAPVSPIDLAECAAALEAELPAGADVAVTECEHASEPRSVSIVVGMWVAPRAHCSWSMSFTPPPRLG